MINNATELNKIKFETQNVRCMLLVLKLTHFVLISTSQPKPFVETYTQKRTQFLIFMYRKYINLETNLFSLLNVKPRSCVFL